MAETGGRVVQHGCQSGSRVSRTLRCVCGWLDAAVTDVRVEREWIRFNDQRTIISLEMTSNSFRASLLPSREAMTHALTRCCRQLQWSRCRRCSRHRLPPDETVEYTRQRRASPCVFGPEYVGPVDYCSGARLTRSFRSRCCAAAMRTSSLCSQIGVMECLPPLDNEGEAS